MAKSRRYPPFYKSLKRRELYPEAKQNIKFLETRTSYMFLNGETLYKLKKTSHDYASPELTEAYLKEEFRWGRVYGGEVYLELVPLSEQEGEYDFTSEGNVVNYALKLQQLSARYFMGSLLERHKLTPTPVGRVARRLAQAHKEHPAQDRDVESGRPEKLYALVEDTLFQTKKYLNITVTQPMLDLIKRPLEKFLEDQKRLFQKRIKKKRVVYTHGAFVPEHIYVRGEAVHFFSALVHRKQAVLDVANDVSSLVAELERQGETELAELFVKRYISASRDRDLLLMLPAYKTLNALRQGVHYAEWMNETEDEERSQWTRISTEFFNLAVKFSRDIPKE